MQKIPKRMPASSLQQVECAIIVTIQETAKQIQILTVKFPGIEHQNRNIREDMLNVVQDLMGTHKGIDLADPGDQQDIALLMRFVLHLLDEGLGRRYIFKLLFQKRRAFRLFHPRNAFEDSLFFTDREKYLIQIALDDPIGSAGRLP